VIYALWIMDKDGKNIFFNSYEGEIKDNYKMVSGLLAAIKTFTKDVSGEETSWIILEDKTFVYKAIGEGYFILYVSEGEKVDDVFDELEEACLTAEGKEELAKKVNEVIVRYNKRRRLDKLDEILRRVGGLP